MVRGTTAINTFEVTDGTDLTGASIVYVTYDQGGKVVIEKSTEDGSVVVDSEEDPNIIRVQLTQSDTLALNSSIPVRIQIRVKYDSGSAIASEIIRTGVIEILKDGEI